MKCKSVLAVISTSLLACLLLTPAGAAPGQTPEVGQGTEAAWQAHCKSALAAQRRGDFANAERLWLDALKESESLSDGRMRLSDTVYQLAQFYCLRGAYANALPVFKRFISLKESNPEKTYFYREWHQCELGDLYYHLKYWQEAVGPYKEALRVWEDARRWPEVVSALDKLGCCFMKENDAPEAEKRFKHALEVWRKSKRLRGLEEHVALMDFFAAHTMTDYAQLLDQMKLTTAAGKMRVEAEQIWRSLDKETSGAGSSSPPRQSILKNMKTDLPVQEKKKVAIAERLAFMFCHRGKYWQAEEVYDWIFDQLTTSAKGEEAGDAIRKEAVVSICRSREDCDKFKPDLFARAAADNPYLGEFSQIRRRADFLSRRTALVSKYAYAVPTQEALSEFRKYQPIVEIGAGTGYWSYLLRKMGLKVLAFELYPLSQGKNAWHPQATKSWTEVLGGDEKVVVKYPHHTLFMCYPPGRTPVAYNALKGFKGDHLLYVGESAGVAPGEGMDKYQDLLKREWVLEKQVALPQWPGLYDNLFVFKRKAK